MSSIHNTQCCLLKAPGVTYERLLPICLTLFSCSSCHAVCMSAATADRSLLCPPLQPALLLFTPHHHFKEPEKWLSHVRLLRYRKGCDPVTPRADLPDLTAIHSPSSTENKNKSYHAPPPHQENRKPLYQCGALTIIYPHDLWFLRQGLLDTYNREVTPRRLSISRLACPYLFSSPSLSSLLLVCTT